MIKNYNERKEAENILNMPLSFNSWKDEVNILTRYYRDNGHNLDYIKDNIIKKYNSNDFLYYQYNDNIEILNNIIDYSWDNGTKLTNIYNIFIKKSDILNLLKLNDKIFTDELLDKLRNKFPDLIIKDKCMNIKRIKVFFTIQIWIIILNNINNCNIINLKKNQKRLLEDSGVKNFKIKRELKLMEEIGLLTFKDDIIKVNNITIEYKIN